MHSWRPAHIYGEVSTLGQPLAAELRRQRDWGGCENDKVAFLRLGGSGNWGGGDLYKSPLFYSRRGKPPLAGLAAGAELQGAPLVLVEPALPLPGGAGAGGDEGADAALGEADLFNLQHRVAASAAGLHIHRHQLDPPLLASFLSVAESALISCGDSNQLARSMAIILTASSSPRPIRAHARATNAVSASSSSCSFDSGMSPMWAMRNV